VEDVEVMKFFETESNLYEGLPDIILGEKGLILLVGYYLLVEVAVIQELHYYAV
jgi:hypothetical protein